MPTALMISGTTIGEIRRPVSRPWPRNRAVLRPRAARVPSTVANMVAGTAMIRLLRIARAHFSVVNTSSYQRQLNPSSG